MNMAALMRTLVALLLLTCLGALRAQNVDSLRALAHDAQAADTLRAQALGDLVRAFAGTGREDSALITARELVSFCRNHALEHRAVLAQGMLGTLHAMTGGYDSARHYQEAVRAWHHAAKDTVQEAEAQLSIGYSYHLQGLYTQALEHSLRGLALAESARDTAAMAHAHVNIAAIRTDLQHLPDAVAQLDQAIALMRPTGDLRIRNALGQAGMLNGRMGNYPEAMAQLQEALAICERIGDMPTASRLLQTMGNVQREQGRNAEALESFQRSSAITQSAYTLIQNRIAEAYVHAAMNAPQKARPLLEEAVRMAESGNDLADASEAYKALADVLEKLGDKAGAYDAFRKHAALRDTLFNEEKTREITRLDMTYGFEKQQLADSLRHEGAMAVQVKEIQKQKVIRNGFVGGFALVALFALVFFMQRNRIAREKARSEELLLNILPAEVAEELKAKGEADAVQIDHVTVLFTDFKGFTALSETLSPKELVRDLNECFSGFDQITTKYGIEKIKTIGDAYMAAGGLPTPNTTHALDVINAALEMRDFIAEGKARKLAAGLPYFEIRIGVHTGPVVAGIVGVKKFQYDIWGDTVNTASRMESSGEVGQVNISEATHELVKNETSLTFSPRGKVQAKGKGELEMYFVRRSSERA